MTVEPLSKHDFFCNTVIISLSITPMGWRYALEHKTQTLMLVYDTKTRKTGKRIVNELNPETQKTSPMII